MSASSFQESHSEPFETDPEDLTRPWLKNGDGVYLHKKNKTLGFCSLDMYVSECGWPNFTKTISERLKKDEQALATRDDNSLKEEKRTEVVTKGEDGKMEHLGHVFNDVPIRIVDMDSETLKKMAFEKGKIYVELNRDSNGKCIENSFKFTIINVDGEIQSGVLSKANIPQIPRGQITDQITKSLAEILQARIEQIIAAIPGISHEHRFCINYSQLEFVPLDKKEGYSTCMKDDPRCRDYLSLFDTGKENKNEYGLKK